MLVGDWTRSTWLNLLGIMIAAPTAPIAITAWCTGVSITGTIRGLTKLVCFGVALPTCALVLGSSVEFFHFLAGDASAWLAIVFVASIVISGVFTLIAGAIQLRVVHGPDRARLVALVVIGVSPLVA